MKMYAPKYNIKKLLGQRMKEQNNRKKQKIYAFIIGIVIGTLVYNLIGIDFSFFAIKRVIIHDFFKGYAYLLQNNIRFFMMIFILSFIKRKNEISLIFIFYQAFVIAGSIVVSIKTKNVLFLYTVPVAFTKILAVCFIFRDRKELMGHFIGMIVILIGVLLENFFIIIF